MFQRIMLKIPIITMMVFSVILGDLKLNIPSPTMSPELTTYTEHQHKATRALHDSGTKEIHEMNSELVEQNEQMKLDSIKNLGSESRSLEQNEPVQLKQFQDLGSKSLGNEPNQENDLVQNSESKIDSLNPTQQVKQNNIYDLGSKLDLFSSNVNQVKEDQILNSKSEVDSLASNQHQAKDSHVIPRSKIDVFPSTQHQAKQDQIHNSVSKHDSAVPTQPQVKKDDTHNLASKIDSVEPSQREVKEDEIRSSGFKPESIEPTKYVEMDQTLQTSRFDSESIESLKSLGMSDTPNLTSESLQTYDPAGHTEIPNSQNLESDPNSVDRLQRNVEIKQSLDPFSSQTLKPSQHVSMDPAQNSESEFQPTDRLASHPTSNMVSDSDRDVSTEQLDIDYLKNPNLESYSSEPTESLKADQMQNVNSGTVNIDSTENLEVDRIQNSDSAYQSVDSTEEGDQKWRSEFVGVEATKEVEVDHTINFAFDSSSKNTEETVYRETSQGYQTQQNYLQDPEYLHQHNIFPDIVQNEVDETKSDPLLIEKHEHPRVNPLLEHANQHHHECKESQRDMEHDDYRTEEKNEYSFKSSFSMAIRHLSSSLIGFLPEHIQDTILDVNDSLVFTGIIALTLVSICVPYFFIEAFFAVHPLKKKVTDLHKRLWKVSTAFENQQEEYDVFKQKALAYDEDNKQIEELELQLHLIKQIEIKLKDENRSLKKRLNADAKVAGELEDFIATTMTDNNQIIEERDKLKAVVLSLQTKLKETVEEFTSLEAEAASTHMDLELLTHTNENLDLRGKALEREIGELKTKFHIEIDLRRGLQTENETLLVEKTSIQEQLVDLKSVLHKYEETVNTLNDEISVKENELLALKETLGEDSPLVDIAEVTGKLKVAEGQATTLQSRVESITLENSSLKRDLEKVKETLKTLQSEKDQAETRLQVLEAYFKEKQEELRRMVEKHETEKEIRGKDKDELIQLIEEKSDEVRDLTQRLSKLKEEFEETKLAHRNEIRALEAKGHETWLSLCQSERKAQDVRKDAELLRQKLTAITKAKELDGNDALSSNGEVPYTFSQLDLEEVPLPMLLPDEPILPSYFGLGDFEPPAPLDDDDDDDDEAMNSLHSRRNPHEPQRPPPLGRISPTYSDQEDEDERELSPIRGMGIRTERRDEFSDGSSSPPPPQGHGGSRESYMNGSMHPRRRQPINASSPLQHGLNL